MTPKFLIPLVFTFGTSTAVIAQETQTDTETDFSLVTIPFDWDDDVVDAFFSEPETGELREESEISSNWQDLSTEQQDIVRQYCESVNGASGMEGMAPVEPTDGAETAPTDPAGEPDAPDASGATDDPGAPEALGATDDPGAADETGAPDALGAADESGALGEMGTDGTAPEMTELCEIVGTL